MAAGEELIFPSQTNLRSEQLWTYKSIGILANFAKLSEMDRDIQQLAYLLTT